MLAPATALSQATVSTIRGVVTDQADSPLRGGQGCNFDDSLEPE